MELILGDAETAYLDLLRQISDTYTEGRVQAVQAVNSHITQTYWQVGRQIVGFEQGGKARADMARRSSANWPATLACAMARGLAVTPT